MQPIVFASLLIAAQRDRQRLSPHEIDELYAGLYTGPRRGLWDLARVTAAIGGIALYAGLLSQVLR
jgi:hypothetical protein